MQYFVFKYFVSWEGRDYRYAARDGVVDEAGMALGWG